MLLNYLQVMENLNLIYEDLDLDNVEKKFIDLVATAFSFDRCALLFTKHKKRELQGKLSRGFNLKTISSISIPLTDKSLFTRPLMNGTPLWGGTCPSKELAADSSIQQLDMHNFVLLPLAGRSLQACWEIKSCTLKNCPAYGKRWLRCWMIPDTLCHCNELAPKAGGSEHCRQCGIFTDRDIGSMEGILLVDNSISNTPISQETVSVLGILANAVGRAVNNSKLYSKTLHEATRDGLTGLYNRRYFDERLRDEVNRANRYNEALSLIICDIDHFKNVNDRHGHPIGDEVLCWSVENLLSGRRKSDIFARFGGEEFAILLLNTDRTQAVRLAEEMRRLFNETQCNVAGQQLSVTMSFGVAELNHSSGSAEDLVEDADNALYRAKNSGRNRVCYAYNDMPHNQPIANRGKSRNSQPIPPPCSVRCL